MATQDKNDMTRNPDKHSSPQGGEAHRGPMGSPQDHEKSQDKTQRSPSDSKFGSAEQNRGSHESERK